MEDGFIWKIDQYVKLGDLMGLRLIGDLLVQTHIEVPKSLTSRQEELLRELAEVEHNHVSPHRKSFLEKLRDYFSVTDETAEKMEP